MSKCSGQSTGVLLGRERRSAASPMVKPSASTARLLVARVQHLVGRSTPEPPW